MSQPTRVRRAMNASVARLSCYSPGVFLAVGAVGIVVIAPHWRGVYAGLKIAGAVGLAAVIAVPVGLALIRTAEWAGDRWSRREAARLAAVSAAYAAQLDESVRQRDRRPASAPSGWEQESAPSGWEQESAPFRAPADVPAIAEAMGAATPEEIGQGVRWYAEARERGLSTGSAPEPGVFGNGRQCASLAGVPWHPLSYYAPAGSEVLERSREAMAASEEQLEAAGREWRSGASMRRGANAWENTPAESKWLEYTRRRGSHQSPPGQPPATDPITGAPIHYDAGA